MELCIRRLGTVTFVKVHLLFYNLHPGPIGYLDPTYTFLSSVGVCLEQVIFTRWV